MSGCAVDLVVPPAMREAVGTWLVEYTGQAIEERPDGTLIGYLASEAESGALQRALQGAFGPGIDVATRLLQDVDWSVHWRDGLAPRRFGRLVVTPSWVSPVEATGPVLVLDPEMAFGTGEHGSTRGALTLLERHLTQGDRVLDLGSGSGILAIAAALLGARTATGIEVDEEALPIAERNAERNGTAGTVRFLCGDAAILTPLLGPVELVLSNILRTVNLSLLDAIHAALAPGGVAVFAGMESPEAALFRPALAAHRFASFDEVEDAGWWSVAARRR